MAKNERLIEKAEACENEKNYYKASKLYIKAIKESEEDPRAQREYAAKLMIFLVRHFNSEDVRTYGWDVIKYINAYNPEFKEFKSFMREGRGSYVGLTGFVEDYGRKYGIEKNQHFRAGSCIDAMKLFTYGGQTGSKPNYHAFYYWLGKYFIAVLGNNIAIWKNSQPSSPEYEEIRKRFINGESHNTVLSELFPFLKKSTVPEAYSMAEYIMNVNMDNRSAAFYRLCARAIDCSESISKAERYSACADGRGVHLEHLHQLISDSKDNLPFKEELIKCLNMWVRRVYQLEERNGSKFASFRLFKRLSGERETTLKRLAAENYPDAVIEEGDTAYFRFSERARYGEIYSYPELKEDFQKSIRKAEELGLPILEKWEKDYNEMMFKNSWDRDKRGSGVVFPKTPDPYQQELEDYKKKLKDRERFANLLSDGLPLTASEMEELGALTNDIDMMADAINTDYLHQDMIKAKEKQLAEQKQEDLLSGAYGGGYPYYDEEPDPETLRKEEEEKAKRALEYKRVSLAGYDAWFSADLPAVATWVNPQSQSPLSPDEELKSDFEKWMKEQGVEI